MHTALRFAPRSLGVHSKFTCGTGKAVARRWYATTPTGVQPDTAETNGGLDALKRSYLYVPSSNVRMLEKSLSTPSDVIIYDLEDSVPPSLEHKKNARSRLTDFLSSSHNLPESGRVAVRLNSIDTPFFLEDVDAALRLPLISTFILPKVHSPEDLHYVSRKILEHRTNIQSAKEPSSNGLINLVASIESARSLINIGGIASWQSQHGPAYGGKLSALLFAAEDYCADTSIIRTSSRRELLYTRSQVSITARAFKLQAIDMVCINFRDSEYLREECQDGRELGYTGKQAIHPAQVDIIQSTFVPTAKEIARAARILHYMQDAHVNERGAIGLPLEGGGEEMIDAPMIKQAENIIRLAKSAGLNIPKVSTQAA